MAEPTRTEERDPLYHVRRIRGMLDDVARHAREDAEKVDDPRAQALFETTSEVLRGLTTAYEHFAKKNEPAWR